MVADSTLYSGAKARALRRSAAYDALSGKRRAAYARVTELEAVVTALHVVAEGGSNVADFDEELAARLAAIMPCLKVQRQYGVRSPTGLVSPNVQLFANAAKHNFSSDFRNLTATEARREQRRGNPPAPVPQLPQLPPLPPPPPPPQLPELDGAIQCCKLEEFRRGLYSGNTSGEHVFNDEATMVFTLVEEDFIDNAFNEVGVTDLIVDRAVCFPDNNVRPSSLDGDTDLNDNASNGHNSNGFPDINGSTSVLDGGTYSNVSASSGLNNYSGHGTKDNVKYWLDRLMQEELACKKQKADKKQAEARGLYIFSEAFSLEHCSIFKPAACVSNLCADGALSLFLKTDSSKHRMKKYHFFRTLKLCPRPMTKAHPHRDCFYWTLF